MSCLTEKLHWYAQVLLCCLPCAGQTNSWWKELDKGITVMITFRKPNNSPVPQNMLRILPCWPNALSIFAELIVVPFGFLAWKLFRCPGWCCFLVPAVCEDLFFTLNLLTFPQTKVTFHFVYWELVLLQAGTRIFHGIFQQTHVWNRVALHTHTHTYAVEQGMWRTQHRLFYWKLHTRSREAVIHGRSILLPTANVACVRNDNFWRRTPGS